MKNIVRWIRNVAVSSKIRAFREAVEEYAQKGKFLSSEKFAGTSKEAIDEDSATTVQGKAGRVATLSLKAYCVAFEGICDHD